MSDKQITTELSNMSVSELPPKLPNFPLPRELRDKIYGYLLDGSYTRSERGSTQSQTMAEFQRHVVEENAYHFHTNLLSVNRAIHQEAEELLYKRNIFIVFSYQWPKMFDRTSGWSWVPTVSRKHVARMTRHSLRIHVSPGTSVLTDLAHQTGKNAPIESCLVLAKDLGSLCFALSVPAALIGSPAIQIQTGLSGDICVRTDILIGRKEKSMQMKLELRDTHYRSMTASLQRDLLTPLSGVISPSQRVVFTGSICDTFQIEGLNRMMGPSLACWTAVAWSYFEKIIMAKDISDAALEHDSPAFVLFQYLAVELLSADQIEKDIVRHELLSNHQQLYEAMHIFHFELLVNIACIRLKMRDIKGFGPAVKAATDFLKKMFQEPGFSHGLPDGLEPYYDSISFWSHLWGSEKITGNLTVGLSIGKLRHTASQHGPHQTHDLSLLESLPDHNTILTRELFPYHRSSIWKLPLPRTSFYKSMPGLEHVDNFKGWHDIDLLRSMDDQKKQSLNVLQKANRVEVTNFDQF